MLLSRKLMIVYSLSSDWVLGLPCGDRSDSVNSLDISKQKSSFPSFMSDSSDSRGGLAGSSHGLGEGVNELISSTPSEASPKLVVAIKGWSGELRLALEYWFCIAIITLIIVFDMSWQAQKKEFFNLHRPKNRKGTNQCNPPLAPFGKISPINFRKVVKISNPRILLSKPYHPPNNESLLTYGAPPACYPNYTHIPAYARSHLYIFFHFFYLCDIWHIIILSK